MITGIIIGILAGFIACKLTHREGMGWLTNLFLGVIGGFVGGWVFELLGITTVGLLGELITSTVGAAIALWVFNKLS